MWSILFVAVAHATTTCDWIDSGTMGDEWNCKSDHSCCPHNGDAGEWGCCPPETFCHVSGGGDGQCCTGDITNCSPVDVDVEVEELSYSGSDLALAFGLTTGAGACTALGVATVYFVEDIEETGVLGDALAFASGVMIYISFIEILSKALEQFETRFDNSAVARTITALSFFMGIGCGYSIDYFVHWLGKQQSSDSAEFVSNDEIELAEMEDGEKGERSDQLDCHADLNLQNITLVTALAIGFHNLPEGLVTFVTTLYSPTSGMAIAVAIAIHNIPEGVSIAVPVYYQTKSFRKAFFWAFISGIAEPIGALIGYAVLDSMFGAEVFGWMFGIVAGIMIYIAVAEMLPVAFKTNAKYKTPTIFAGMFVMELSLIFFEI